ncbi:hypothetical protein [Methylomonas rhizoryzae]|uniref:hypothetical protein n=1 Tax=Methylomonas rhizoryzae TaxID=2608981 RepID=UPI0012324C0F|nr:hypothetical protein [Methylomonas rhizoryzae]
MPGFLPENPGVIDVEEVAEIRRLHFVEKATVSELAKQFKLSCPTIRKHLHTLDEPVYPVRKSQPHPKLGPFRNQLEQWLEADSRLGSSDVDRCSY